MLTLSLSISSYNKGYNTLSDSIRQFVCPKNMGRCIHSLDDILYAFLYAQTVDAVNQCVVPISDAAVQIDIHPS